MTNDPMESAYLLFNMWSQAVTQAGSADVGAVRQAMIGQRVASPGGYTAVMNANHHITKPVMIGEVRATGQFEIVYRSEPIAPVPWSPYLPSNAKLTSNAAVTQ